MNWQKCLLIGENKIKAAQIILKNPDKPGDISEDIIDFFNDLGSALEDHEMTRRRIWYDYSIYIQYYWETCFERAIRKQKGDESEYVAPIGAKPSFALWFYKEAAPTALRAKIGGRLGAAAQRRRRGISVEPKGPEIQSPSGAAYSEHQHNVLSTND